MEHNGTKWKGTQRNGAEQIAAHSIV